MFYNYKRIILEAKYRCFNCSRDALSCSDQNCFQRTVVEQKPFEIRLSSKSKSGDLTNLTSFFLTVASWGAELFDGGRHFSIRPGAALPHVGAPIFTHAMMFHSILLEYTSITVTVTGEQNTCSGRAAGTVISGCDTKMKSWARQGTQSDSNMNNLHPNHDVRRGDKGNDSIGIWARKEHQYGVTTRRFFSKLENYVNGTAIQGKLNG